MTMKPQQIQAVCLGKKFLTSTVIEVTFRIETPEFTFTSGQYATMMIDQTTRRQYSFASSPAELPLVTFIIDTAPMGPGSKWALGLTEGSKVSMIAPLGNFVLEESSKKKVLVCTGTGIAPFRSMLRNMVHRSSVFGHGKDVHELLPTTNDQRPTTYALYWGLRHEDDIYWDDEFQALAGQYTGFQYFLCLSKPTEKWEGLIGHVTEHVLEHEKDVLNTEFYLCGNKGMIEGLKNALLEKNTPEQQIKTDLFF